MSISVCLKQTVPAVFDVVNVHDCCLTCELTVSLALTNAFCEATCWQRASGSQFAHPRNISPSLRCVCCSSLTLFPRCRSTWRLASGRTDMAASMGGSLAQMVRAQRPQSVAAVSEVVLLVQEGIAAAAASNMRPQGWQVPCQQACNSWTFFS